MSIEKDLQEAIKKNLPSEVGDSLKEALNQGELDAARLQDSSRALKKQDEEIERLKGKTANQFTLLEKAGDLAKREAEVLSRENVIDVRIAEINAAASCLRADDLKDLFALVFSNPKIKRVVRVSEETPIIRDGYSQGTVHSEKTTETTEEPNG